MSTILRLDLETTQRLRISGRNAFDSMPSPEGYTGEYRYNDVLMTLDIEYEKQPERYLITMPSVLDRAMPRRYPMSYGRLVASPEPKVSWLDRLKRIW